MVKKIEDTFIRFDRIHEHDRWTDDRHRETAALLHSIARQKCTAAYVELFADESGGRFSQFFWINAWNRLIVS